MERREHQKVIVFRPLYAVGGQELGFLPGTEAEKMNPWGQAVYDTLGAVASPHVVEEVVERDMLEVLPLTHIRGRSLHDAFVIVDEAQSLLGLNDYTAYCKRSEFGTSIRTLQEFNWHRDEYGVVVARITADAFCHSMVRSMVGAMVHVGDGRKPVAWPKQLLDAGERTSHVAPARGLVLEEVVYPADEDLLARQEFTRATRDASELD